MKRLLSLFLSALLYLSPAQAAVVQITVKDAAGTTRSFNVTTNTDITGNLDSNSVICDQAAGTTCASVGTAGSPSTNALTVQPVTLGNGTSANAARVTISNDSTGTVAVTNAGTFAVQATLQASATTAIGKVDPNTIANWGLAAASQNVAAPTNGMLGLCQFTTSPTTISTTNVSPLQCDNANNVLVKVSNTNTNGQATMANSSPVVIASNQSAVPVSLQAIASGGWTPKWFVAANSDNATNLKASAGTVHAVQVFGIGSAPAYLKFYNKATSPTCGTDTIVKQVMIPAASTAANGAGAIAVTLDTAFSTGISYCVVTGITAADDTAPAASTFVVNIDWL